MKTPESDHQDLSRIEQEAAEWVLKNDRGLTPEEQDALTDWLAADPRHRDAYSMHSWGWDELDRLAGLHTRHPLSADEDLLKVSSPEKPRRFTAKRVVIGLALAASVVLFFSLSFTVFRNFGDSASTEAPIVYERIQQMHLDDGSRIELNHGAKVRAAYTENERAIHLLEGEANFSVAKNPDRPFVVYVAGVRLCALGTVFNVRYNMETVDLIVTEGRVQVLNNGMNETENQTVRESPVINRSQRAIVSLNSNDRDVVIRQLNPVEIEEELLWRPELIDFNDEFLPVIVDDFNRRNRVQIVLDDPALHELKLTSIFWSDNVEAFVRLLESNFNVRVDRRSKYEIRLSLYS